LGICSPRVLLKPCLNTFDPKSLVGKHLSLVLILYLSSVWNTILRGSVDIGLVHHIAVGVVNCTAK
jgi:hypothetical protein